MRSLSSVLCYTSLLFSYHYFEVECFSAHKFGQRLYGLLPKIQYDSPETITKTTHMKTDPIPSSMQTEHSSPATATSHDSLTSTATHLSTPHHNKCHLFRSSPELRKIIITYLHRKIFAYYHHHTGDSEIILCTQERIHELLVQLVPPLPLPRIAKEVSELYSKLAGSHSCRTIPERELAIDLLFENSLWKEVGEMVVKEFVYLDYLAYSFDHDHTHHHSHSVETAAAAATVVAGSSASSTGSSSSQVGTIVGLEEDEAPAFLLSEYCARKLEASLREDGSNILLFSPEEASKIMQQIRCFNQGNLQQGNNQQPTTSSSSSSLLPPIGGGLQQSRLLVEHSGAEKKKKVTKKGDEEADELEDETEDEDDEEEEAEADSNNKLQLQQDGFAKYEPYDTCGNPTLMYYFAARMRGEGCV